MAQLVRTKAGRMSSLIRKPPTPKAMKKVEAVDEGIDAARMRARKRNLVEAYSTKRGFTQFMPRWLRRGQTRAG